MGDPEKWVRGHARRGQADHGLRASRLPRRGSALESSSRRTARELGSPQIEIAEQLEEAALAELERRHPERPLKTNVEYYSAPFSTSRRSRRRSRRRCSPARASPAGRRTSSSRSEPAGSSGRPRGTSARRRARCSRRDARRGGCRGGRPRAGRRRARARAAPLAVGRGDRGRRAQRRLPRPRAGLSRDRAVPVPPEARAPAPRARGREPGGARLGAHRARRPVARPSGRRQLVPAAPARPRRARPERRGEAARGRVPAQRHAAAATIQLLDGIADSDEEDAELRKTARSVSALLLKKSRAK